MWHRVLVVPRHVGSSQTRAQTCVPCIGRQILNHCTTREAPPGGYCIILANWSRAVVSNKIVQNRVYGMQMVVAWNDHLQARLESSSFLMHIYLASLLFRSFQDLRPYKMANLNHCSIPLSLPHPLTFLITKENCEFCNRKKI